MGETQRKGISAMWAREAEDAEAHRDRMGPLHRTRPAREPAQVYSVRMPVDKLEELRQHAESAGVTPSALMREWVLERLAWGDPAAREDSLKRQLASIEDGQSSQLELLRELSSALEHLVNEKSRLAKERRRRARQEESREKLVEASS